MTTSPLPHRLVTVFQAANEDRREIYVGVTDLLTGRLLEELEAHRPIPIRHWTADERVAVRGIVYAIPAQDAVSFIEAYKLGALPADWRLISDVFATGQPTC